MGNISLGVHFIVTGMAVVFISLTVMSGAMWLTGKLFGEKTRRGPASVRGGSPHGLSEYETAAVAAAVCAYRAEKETAAGNGETVTVFKPLTRWKVRARVESVERHR